MLSVIYLVFSATRLTKGVVATPVRPILSILTPYDAYFGVNG